MPSPENNVSRSSDSTLRASLLSRLSTLPFAAFARCCALILARMGYQNVRLSGRRHFRGRNQHGLGKEQVPPSSGGYDLIANLPAPKGAKTCRSVVVSLKQFPPDAPARVFQRQVDELRGASLRAGASEALLLTTGAVSPMIAHGSGLPFAPIAPIHIVDGEELADLCVRFGVGLVPAEDGRSSTNVHQADCVIDEPFFERLAHTGNPGNGPTDFDGRNEHGTEPPLSFDIHVSVEPVDIKLFRGKR